MSGPIVRKYGFPNFEKIFGTRDVPHGSDEPEVGPDAASLPPDLPHRAEPVDPTKPESAGTIAPATEFGNAVD